MPKVTIDPFALSDSRFVRLAKLMGSDAANALNRMIFIWAECTERGTYHLNRDQIRDIHDDLPNFGKWMLAARLARTSRWGLYICGTKGRIEWLSRLRKNGRFGSDGGRPLASTVRFVQEKPSRVKKKKPYRVKKKKPSRVKKTRKRESHVPQENLTLQGYENLTLQGYKNLTLQGSKKITPLASALKALPPQSVRKKSFHHHHHPDADDGGAVEALKRKRGREKEDAARWGVISPVSIDEYRLCPPPGGGKRERRLPCPNCGDGAQLAERVCQLTPDTGSIRIQICDDCAAQSFSGSLEAANVT